MAEHDIQATEVTESNVESTDRGMLDFLGKKKDESASEDALNAEFEQKVVVEEPAEKKEGLFKKLTRSSSSSSSSSSDEEDEEKKKKKEEKKKKKEKKQKEKKGEDDTVVPVNKCDVEEAPPAVACEPSGAAPVEKKGILEKIKEKLPGYHHKTESEADATEKH